MQTDDTSVNSLPYRGDSIYVQLMHFHMHLARVGKKAIPNTFELADKGRGTKLKILECFKTNEQVTMREIINRTKASEAWIYRNLKELEKLGEVRVVSINGKGLNADTVLTRSKRKPHASY